MGNPDLEHLFAWVNLEAMSRRPIADHRTQGVPRTIGISCPSGMYDERKALVLEPYARINFGQDRRQLTPQIGNPRGLIEGGQFAAFPAFCAVQPTDDEALDCAEVTKLQDGARVSARHDGELCSCAGELRESVNHARNRT